MSAGHPYRIIAAIVIALGMASSISHGRQPDGPPFVRGYTIEVVDPATDQPSMLRVQRLSHLEAVDEAGEAGEGGAEHGGGDVIGAAVTDADGRLGVALFAGDDLRLIETRWVTGDEEGAWRWGTSTSLPGGAAVWIGSRTDQPAVSRLVRFDPDAPDPWAVRDVEVPERVVALVYAPTHERYYGLTAPSNKLIVWDRAFVRIAMHEEIFDFVPYEYPPGRALAVDAAGVVYGSYKGRLFGFHPGDAFFEYLGHIPCEYGHLSEVAITAFASDDKARLVGGTGADGYLFSLDLKSREVIPHGKPTDGTRIRSIVHVGNGAYLGIAEAPGQSCRLFRFQPEAGRLEDLGVPAGTLREGDRTWTWHAFEVTDALALPDGRVVLGEAGHQAKLLVIHTQEDDAS